MRQLWDALGTPEKVTVVLSFLGVLGTASWKLLKATYEAWKAARLTYTIQRRSLQTEPRLHEDTRAEVQTRTTIRVELGDVLQNRSVMCVTLRYRGPRSLHDFEASIKMTSGEIVGPTVLTSPEDSLERGGELIFSHKNANVKFKHIRPGDVLIVKMVCTADASAKLEVNNQGFEVREIMPSAV